MCSESVESLGANILLYFYSANLLSNHLLQILPQRLVLAIHETAFLATCEQSFVGVAAPAGGIVPAFAVAGGIHVDAHNDGLLHGVANLAGDLVGRAYAFLQGDICPLLRGPRADSCCGGSKGSLPLFCLLMSCDFKKKLYLCT